jgi:regulator of protease activity HflC (stomatin/prohibitin superfamily)
MSKTIDVEGGTVGPTPPHRIPPRARPGGRAKLPPLAAITAGLFVAAIVAGVALAATGRLGVTKIDSSEVAVVVNYVTGDHEIVNTPGYRMYLPFVEEVFTFDKRPQDFVMQGPQYRSSNHVPQLTVREKNGSNFRIDDLHIQYEMIPEAADTVLHDSGPSDAYKQEWIKGHARSILRDEFGRFDAIEAADPTVYKQATPPAEDRLNALLERHGIRVTNIITPNPSFDDEYEDAIETRKKADQEAERLVAQLKQLEQEQVRQLQDVEREKSVEMKELMGDLDQALRAAEQQATKIRGEADAYAIERAAQAEASYQQRIEQARGLEEKYRKEAEGILARAQALEQRGEVVVREAIVQKLLAVRFTLLPYSRDPNPTRLEHSGEAAAANVHVVPELGGGL